MNKDVIISIEAIQHYPEQEPERMFTEVNAEYYLKNSSHYIMFEECQEGFLEKTKSLLKVKRNSVELTKKGLVHSHMFFEENQIFATEYRTPFGSFLMDIHTEKLDVYETATGIGIKIMYSLKSREQKIADCNMKISIKEKQSAE